MITERKRGGWTFVFMGANQDSYAEAGRLGLDDGSVQDFRADKQGVHAAFGSFNRAVREYRGAARGERLRRKKGFFAGRKEAEVRPGDARDPDDNRSLLHELVAAGRLSCTLGRSLRAARPVRSRIGLLEPGARHDARPCHR